MNKEILSKAKDKAFSEICLRYNVKRLYLFGSQVRGDFDQNSDIDVLVEFKMKEVENAFYQFMGLKEELEVFFEKPVDILVNKKFRNHIFAEKINAEKEILYAA